MQFQSGHSAVQSKLCQLILCLLPMTVLALGCDVPDQADSGIINKKTQDIGEFNPDGGGKIADLQVKASANPYASVGAYGFAVSEISKHTITQAQNLFQAEHGRMPKDHEEFMTQIIKKNNIQLPVLPGGRQYQYDLEKHELVVVEADKSASETSK